MYKNQNHIAKKLASPNNYGKLLAKDALFHAVLNHSHIKHTMNNFTEEDIRRMTSGGTLSANSPIRQIIIGVPRIEITNGTAYQFCTIRIGNIEKEIFFSVDEEYAKYLCCERGDAYLIGLLSFAMRERCNIHSEIPLTGELVHQIQTELIPPVVSYAQGLYAPVITGTLDNTPLPRAKKTATGCSCGIDSLNAIKQMSESTGGMYKPDYLVINNVGAYTANAKTSDERYKQNAENAHRFAKAYGVPLIVTNSNFADAIPQNHYLTHVYSSSFAIYMLQKLWSRYYYASAGTNLEGRFSLIRNEMKSPACYDLIALPALSVSQLRICNESAVTTRYEKTRYIADYPLAHQFLNVCLQQGSGNCGVCPKCLRTLWTLDALGKLDNFAQVLPVNQYKTYRKYYLRKLYVAHRKGWQMVDESYEILEKDMSFLLKVHAIMDDKLQDSGCWQKLRRKLKGLIRR